MQKFKKYWGWWLGTKAKWLKKVIKKSFKKIKGRGTKWRDKGLLEGEKEIRLHILCLYTHIYILRLTYAGRRKNPFKVGASLSTARPLPPDLHRLNFVIFFSLFRYYYYYYYLRPLLLQRLFLSILHNLSCRIYRYILLNSPTWQLQCALACQLKLWRKFLMGARSALHVDIILKEKKKPTFINSRTLLITGIHSFANVRYELNGEMHYNVVRQK